jgi:hypothetical protein
LYACGYAVFTISTHQYAEVVYSDAFQEVEFLVQAFAVTTLALRTKDGSIPKVGAYEVVGFAIAYELSVGIYFDEGIRVLFGCAGYE